MPTDRPTKLHIATQQTAAGRTGPLSASEQAVLDRLLERKGESEPAALARRERERRERERLERKQAKLAAKEEKLALQLRQLQSDVDCVTDQIVLIDERLSGVARRDVVNCLNKFQALTARFIEENGMPVPPRAAIRAFAELAMTPYLTRGPSLRQRLSDGKGDEQ
jgi:hypothetical protein